MAEKEVEDGAASHDSEILTTPLEHDSKYEQYPTRNFRFHLAFVSVCACTFIATVDTVIVATALPAITRALHATSNEAYWCGTGFLFAQTVSQPLYGAFQEVVGHKRTMMFALGLFLFMSIFCATAKNITWLVTSRVIQGIGGGGINAMVNVLVSDLVPLHDRGTFAGLNNLAGAVGLVSGVVLGAAFAEKSTWRLIFWINLPICTIAGAGIFLGVRLKTETDSIRSQLHKVDYLGALLLISSLVSILYGLTGGGILYPWSHARIITALVIGGLGIVLTALYEVKYAPHPMIPPAIFRDRTAVSGYFSAWVHGIVLWALAYYLILYFLIARGHSLLHSALEILPGIATIPVCAALFGIIMAITKHFKWLNVFAWASLSIGVGLLALLTAHTGLGKAYGYQIVLAVGGGIIFPGRILAVQVSQKPANVPIATTMVSFFTSLGEAFGVAIGGSIFQNRWSALTKDAITSGRLPREYLINSDAAEGSAERLKLLPFGVRDAYRGIMAESLRTLWITFAALAAAAFFVSLIARDLSLAEKRDEGDLEEAHTPEVMATTSQNKRSEARGAADNEAA
ncbi:major facilitator superfamily domain-containing protein [Lophiotrema nucula]|uniref:Major facilitator superfamily domain-containing protein n=1 Tax=Lophiotrema nucula TaxID=690887 RepID=A0A6A5ZM69_9PLEO|nr:major facilitator superfamily domain-containing protein [Lophiotrema nucula]